MKASRAGTGGFRPPEVLLKSQKQDQKIDVWAAGVCFIVLLARRLVPKCSLESGLFFISICSIGKFSSFWVIINLRYPYFPAVDDNLALSHIAALLGSAGLRDAAASMGRKLTTANLPEANLSVQQFVRKQRSSNQATKDGQFLSTRWVFSIENIYSKCSLESPLHFQSICFIRQSSRNWVKREKLGTSTVFWQYIDF